MINEFKSHKALKIINFVSEPVGIGFFAYLSLYKDCIEEN